MPYNISRACVHRSKRYLDELAEKRRTLTFPAHKPLKLVYQIREAVYAAKRHKEFVKYHDLQENYRFRPREGWVEAEYVGEPVKVEVVGPPALTVTEARQLMEVVGACIKFGPKTNEIHFPNAVLEPEDLGTLLEWGRGDGWKLISHDDKGLTVTRRGDVDEAFLWGPT